MLAIAVLATIIAPGKPTYAAGERITVTTPTGRFIPLGQPILLNINVRADSLVSGSVRIEGDAPTPIILPVELPGGTAKEFTIVVPQLTYSGAEYSVRLVDSAGKKLASTNLTTAIQPGDSTVGVFPALTADMPDTVRNPIGVTAHLFAFDPAQFEFAIAGIATYDSLVITPTELAKLDPSALDVVEAWLVTGGRLVVDAKPGTAAEPAITSLPAAWQPVTGTSRAVGNGAVVFSGGAIQSGRWDRATAPVPIRSGSTENERFGFERIEPLSTSLARFTNASITSGRTIAIAIGLYALVVGPGLFMLFRRRRERIWLAAPLVALLATAGVWMVGHQKRSHIGNAHGVVIAVSDAGSQAAAFDLNFASRSGPQSFTLPSGYIADQPLWNEASNLPLTVDNAPTGNVLSQPASSGSFNLFGGRGVVPQYDGGLVTAGKVDHDALIGTVENHLAVTLTNVAVMWNGSAVNIGDLEPGATTKFKVPPPDQNFGFIPLQALAWPDAIPKNQFFMTDDPNLMKPYNPNTDVALGLADQYNTLLPGATTRPDQFVVGGWSRKLPNPLSNTTTGTAFVAAHQLVSQDTANRSGAVGVISATESDDIDLNFAVTHLLQMTPPPAASATTENALVLARTAGWTNTEVFVGGAWVTLADGTKPVALPDSALDSAGYVYVRSDTEDFDPISFKLPALERRTFDPKQHTILAFDDVIVPEGKTKPATTDDPAANPAGGGG